MKQKCRALFAAVLFMAVLFVSAGASSYDHYADQLKELGLFQGTNQGYDLDRAPTRAEAATMLVRLLGKEDAAKELQYTAPFTDLKGWEKPYVQYLYDHGLTTGATATTFEPLKPCSAQMYTTFLLRSLGYSDAEGADFSYAQAISFGRSIGLVNAANCNESRFLRDHVVAMSMAALGTEMKGADDMLLEKLVEEGAVDAAAAEEVLRQFDSDQQSMETPEEQQPVEQPEVEQPVDRPEEQQPEEEPEEQQPVEQPDASGDYVSQVVALVNQERAKVGLPALTVDSTAQQAAQLRAEEIVQSFSHTRPDGSSCFTALQEMGGSYRMVGENIAAGYATPQAVMNGWMNSTGHRENILRDGFTAIGVGYTVSDGMAYWVQMFVA